MYSIPHYYGQEYKQYKLRAGDSGRQCSRALCRRVHVAITTYTPVALRFNALLGIVSITM